jgi:hypothetical protein
MWSRQLSAVPPIAAQQRTCREVCVGPIGDVGRPGWLGSCCFRTQLLRYLNDNVERLIDIRFSHIK